MAASACCASQEAFAAVALPKQLHVVLARTSLIFLLPAVSVALLIATILTWALWTPVTVYPALKVSSQRQAVAPASLSARLAPFSQLARASAALLALLPLCLIAHVARLAQLGLSLTVLQAIALCASRAAGSQLLARPLATCALRAPAALRWEQSRRLCACSVQLEPMLQQGLEHVKAAAQADFPWPLQVHVLPALLELLAHRQMPPPAHLAALDFSPQQAPLAVRPVSLEVTPLALPPLARHALEVSTTLLLHKPVVLRAFPAGLAYLAHLALLPAVPPVQRAHTAEMAVLHASLAPLDRFSPAAARVCVCLAPLDRSAGRGPQAVVCVLLDGMQPWPTLPLAVLAQLARGLLPLVQPMPQSA
jgi:hypothetical protein